MEELHEVTVIAEFEGLDIQEARLSYAARQNLPASAFCGPDKSYPAQDAVHVGKGFQRLSQFGKRMPKTIALKIYRCLLRRAKKFGVKHNPKPFGWLTGKKSVEETFAENDIETKKLLGWFFEEMK